MVAWATTCSPHPPPRSWVNPSVRPELITRLSRLRHDDVQPRAQLRQGGAMSRAAQGMHGSTTTRVPTGYGHPGPTSITPTGDLVTEHEGKGTHGHQGG